MMPVIRLHIRGSFRCHVPHIVRVSLEFSLYNDDIDLRLKIQHLADRSIDRLSGEEKMANINALD